MSNGREVTRLLVYCLCLVLLRMLHFQSRRLCRHTVWHQAVRGLRARAVRRTQTGASSPVSVRPKINAKALSELSDAELYAALKQDIAESSSRLSEPGAAIAASGRLDKPIGTARGNQQYMPVIMACYNCTGLLYCLIR
jgi:hypothetical protein